MQVTPYSTLVNPRNPDGTYKGFGAPMVVNTGTDNLVYSTAGGDFPHTVLGGTEGKSIGFDGYVGKPINLKEFLDAVRGILARNDR